MSKVDGGVWWLEASVDRIIQAAVALERGNRSRAADRLGVGLRTVQRKLSTSRVG